MTTIRRTISDRAVDDDPKALARFINDEVRPLLRELRRRWNDEQPVVETSSDDYVDAGTHGTTETAFSKFFDCGEAIGDGTGVLLTIPLVITSTASPTITIRVYEGSASGTLVYTSSTNGSPIAVVTGGITLAIIGASAVGSLVSVYAAPVASTSWMTSTRTYNTTEQPVSISVSGGAKFYVTAQWSAATAGNRVEMPFTITEFVG